MTPTRHVAPAWECRDVAFVTTGASGAALVVAVALGAFLPAFAKALGPALLVVAAVVSLPHGAVDHLAVGWRRGRTGPARRGLLVGYAIAALVAAGVAVTWPAPSVLALLALSVAHFAEGESAFDRLRGGHGRQAPAWAIGASIVAGPLLVRPEQARPLLVALDPALPGLLAPLRVVALVTVAVLVVAGLVVALRDGSRVVAAEVAVVALGAAVGPALLVFAVWFGGWHAPRHLVRLAALVPDGDGRERRTALVRGAVGPTAVAVVGMVTLAVVLGGVPSGALVALLALTVPHAAVVGWLGWERRWPVPQ